MFVICDLEKKITVCIRNRRKIGYGEEDECLRMIEKEWVREGNSGKRGEKRR